MNGIVLATGDLAPDRDGRIAGLPPGRYHLEVVPYAAAGAPHAGFRGHGRRTPGASGFLDSIASPTARRAHPPMASDSRSRPVQVDALQAFIARALRAAGMPAADAGITATLMSQADLQGSDGHGVIRLPQYVKRIRAGGINVRPQMQVVHERPGSAVLDGDNGMVIGGELVLALSIIPVEAFDDRSVRQPRLPRCPNDRLGDHVVEHVAIA